MWVIVRCIFFLARDGLEKLRMAVFYSDTKRSSDFSHCFFLAPLFACEQAVRTCVETYCYLGTEQMRRTVMDEGEALYLQGHHDSLSQTTPNALLLCCLHWVGTAFCPLCRHVLASSRLQRAKLFIPSCNNIFDALVKGADNLFLWNACPLYRMKAGALCSELTTGNL